MLSINELLENSEERFAGIKELITLGEEKGYLHYDEIQDVLADHIQSSKDLDRILQVVGDAGIQVIDSEQKLEAVKLKTRPKAVEKEGKQGPYPASDSWEKTNDPVRIYLREMGTVPLLTRQGEVEIAKRIERGQESVREALFRSPAVIVEISKYGDQLRNNDLTIKSLVKFSEDDLTDEILTKRRRCG